MLNPEFLLGKLKHNGFVIDVFSVSPLPVQIFENIEKNVINYPAPFTVKIKLYELFQNKKTEEKKLRSLAEEKAVFCLSFLNEKILNSLREKEVEIGLEKLWILTETKGGLYLSDFFEEEVVPLIFLTKNGKIQKIFEEQLNQKNVQLLRLSVEDGFRIFENQMKLALNTLKKLNDFLSTCFVKSKNFIIFDRFLIMPSKFFQTVEEFSELPQNLLDINLNTLSIFWIYQEKFNKFLEEVLKKFEFRKNIIEKEELQKILKLYLKSLEDQKEKELEAIKRKLSCGEKLLQQFSSDTSLDTEKKTQDEIPKLIKSKKKKRLN